MKQLLFLLTVFLVFKGNWRHTEKYHNRASLAVCELSSNMNIYDNEAPQIGNVNAVD